MGVSRSIRRTERKVGRLVTSRKAPPRFAFPQRATPPGPGIHFSGLGYFFIVESPRVFCTIPKSIPSPRSFTCHIIPHSTHIPLERKSRLGATRSVFHE